jgi:hypothetical protein
MSQINPTNINANFPVEGQDNPSQGFRDNFANIKTALTQARDELDDLQSFTAKLRDDANINTLVTNDFNKNIIKNAVLDYTSMKFQPAIGNVSGGSVPINLQLGLVHKVSVTGNAILQFTNWPTPLDSTVSLCHKIILHVKFNFATNDDDKFTYKVKFTTQSGAPIKSCEPLKYEFNQNNSYSWYLQPSIISEIASKDGVELNNVSLTSNTGAFTCNTTSLTAGNFVTVSGTNTGTGSIANYSDPTTYKILGSNGTTSFTLVNLNNSPIVTSTGSLVGLTFKQHTNLDHANDYEHVFEVWSYNPNDAVFVNYIGKFIGV